jgi:hypothetical protein
MTTSVLSSNRGLQIFSNPTVGRSSRGVLPMVRVDVPVRVPRIGVLVADAAGEDLHEPHAVLHQPPRHQALASVLFGDLVVQAVQLFRRLRFG